MTNKPNGPTIPNEPNTPFVTNKPNEPTIPNEPNEPKNPNTQKESSITDKPIIPNIPKETNKPVGTSFPVMPTIPNKPRCVIGENEKCKSCDLIQPEFCDECNDGYYLSEADKTKCTKCSVSKCKHCPNNKCLHCMDDNTEINYPYLTEERVLEITLKNMKLTKHSSKNIYCEFTENKGIVLGASNYYYIWNNYKRKMIKISGKQCTKITMFFGDKNPFNNEYLQAVNQGYKFTYQDHIYEKNHKIYKYNDQTLLFDKIQFITKVNSIFFCIKPCKTGFGELCKECDKNEPEYCGSCNDGFYLSYDDRTKCKLCPIGRDGRECFKNYYEIEEPKGHLSHENF